MAVVVVVVVVVVEVLTGDPSATRIPEYTVPKPPLPSTPPTW